jgi:arsenite methyltransferase
MARIHRDDDTAKPLSYEEAVRDRYAAASHAAEPALCCPIDYDPQYLKLLPDEILERDYGCGDPSKYVREGDVVLDLGSGGGKICYIASQIVGPEGRVIGVDMTDDMLALARKYEGEMAERIGYANVSFHKGKIQDLRTDLDEVEQHLAAHPLQSVADLQRFEAWQRKFQADPMIPDASVDVVVSNCVLNLVAPADKPQLFAEIFRVLKKGGRAAISDIVSDETVPPEMVNDPTLWSGCISGALREDEFLAAFEDAGFHGVEFSVYQDEPWQTVNGIQFRSVTVTAWKGKQGACWDRNQAVIYKGPYKAVLDDDGHTYPRGQRVAVCEKTFELLKAGPYADHFVYVEPLQEVPRDAMKPFDCSVPTAVSPASPWAGVVARSPRDTKGADYAETVEGCDPGCC